MADDPQILGATFDQPPGDALKAFRAKGFRPTVGWREMAADEHARDFTVAKAAQLDTLVAIRQAVVAAIAEGQTFEQFQKGLVPTLQRQGWWGLVQKPELTGTTQPVFVGPNRLRTIYDTNLRVSRAAGDWARYQATKEYRPYLRYSAVLDNRTRPEHAAWHGTILPIDHPWWQTHFPPCGWNCRCTTISVSDYELKSRGWSVAAKPPPDLGPPRPFWRPGASAPELVPHGIDPGFAYNPGEAAWRAAAEKAATSAANAAQAGAASQATQMLAELLAAPEFQRFVAAPAGRFPAMLLDDAAMAAVGGGEQRVAWMGTDAIAGLDAAIVRQLPGLGQGAEKVVALGADRVVIARDGDGWLAAYIRPSFDGRSLTIDRVDRLDDAALKLLLDGAELLLSAS
ncbi:MAG: phage minor head protein [Sphingomonadaceae bacterium]|nr:phage minor head protein [Sphingomonadaceae bacterium]